MYACKFKVWEKKQKGFIQGFNLINFHDYYNKGVEPTIQRYGGEWKLSDIILVLCIGLKDKNSLEIYVHDIMKFDNGDKFVLRMENYLAVYVHWIGEPECEDQARDLYRIEDAAIIGNELESPELLKIEKT